MLVVPDIEEEMISPLRDRAFVDPYASRYACPSLWFLPQNLPFTRNLIENLLDTIVSRFSASPEPTCALGAALRGCIASLANCGGHAILFHASACNVGPGIRTQFNDESSMYDTDKEKMLFAPKEGFWLDIAEECADAGIGVSMFVGTGQRSFVDIASVGTRGDRLCIQIAIDTYTQVSHQI
jgi:protein transport protein SEC24